MIIVELAEKLRLIPGVMMVQLFKQSNHQNDIPFYSEWQKYQDENIESPAVREVVMQSWKEAKSFGISGYSPPKNILLNEKQFEVILNRSNQLVNTVNHHVNQLLQRVDENVKYTLMLFNDQGVLLKIFDHPKNIRRYACLGIKPGLLGGFPFHGHSALSIALKTKKPQYTIGAEHYFSSYHHLSSIAVPILHPLNHELIGCLLLISNHLDIHSGYMEMVTSLAITVEEAIRIDYSISNQFLIYEEIANHIDQHILVIGSNGKILSCNKSFQQLLRDRLIIGRNLEELIQDYTDLDYTHSYLYQAVHMGIEVTNQEIWVTIHEQRYCFLIDTKIIYDPYDPKFYWVIVILKDITQKKEMDRQWVQKEKLVSLGQLAAGVAHEIRNPLTTAKGFIQLLGEGSPDKDKFDLINEELDRIAHLVNRFVLLAKPDHPVIKPLDLNELINEFVTFISPEALYHNITIETLQNPQQVKIKADKSQLTQVFINIAQNSFYAMKNGGIFTIEYEEYDEYEVEIRFKDNGSGIEKEHLDKIFDPFFTTKDDGTGLGLPICYQIITAHNGTLKIDSEINKGTCVSIRLPKHRSL